MQAYKDNPRPRKLGRMFAFWYNNQNVPRIVVGPDWGFSLLELAIVNTIIALVLNSARVQGMWMLFVVGFSILMLHNLAFASTVMLN